MSVPSKPGDRISELVVEQYALGELSSEHAERLAAEHGEQLDRRLNALRAADEAFAERYPAGPAARQIADAIAAHHRRTQVSVPVPWFQRWQVMVPTLAAGAAAAVLLLWSAPDVAEGDSHASVVAMAQTPASPDAQATRLKGTAPRIVVYRQIAGAAGKERLTPGTSASAGDRLQLAYVAAGRKDGVIVSIDGRGSVTLHHPTTVGGSTKLLPSGEQLLEHAFELDDAPYFERFIFVVNDGKSASAPELSQVQAAADALAKSGDLQRMRGARLALPASLTHFDFVVEKPSGVPVATGGGL